jgi:hypothetical protein
MTDLASRIAEAFAAAEAVAFIYAFSPRGDLR